MIREFWVENYLSIRERQTMNFETSSSGDDWTSASPAPGVNLSRVGVIFGANASGKSNMLKAMRDVFRLMFMPRSNRSEAVCSESPFALTADQPTRMYVSFYADAVRYDYLVEYVNSHLLHEEMHYYPKGSKSLFYERDYVGEDRQCRIRFGASVGVKVRTLATLRDNTLNNHSVLSTFGKVALSDEAAKVAGIYNWIKAHVCSVCGDSVALPSLLRSVNSDASKKQFFMQMLRKADFNITGFIVYPDADSDRVDFISAVSGKSFALPEASQSSGTIKYVMKLHYLYEAIAGDRIFFLDELGEDLHHDLLLHYVNVFLANSRQSQLLFTSQEMALLSEELFNDNRHLVWFAEKSQDTASSEYTRADRLGLHRRNSLYNSYRIGRFGAKPALGSPFITVR